ncbi:heavy-metal-associated domain-containing protein [Microbacterium sp. RD1]|uniref:heavy-metal-associated domain-containing protein n=1 Tax=Microbacterium sp. RD1 TaxID=3457313 RepID=UPI003FA6063F
MTAATEIELRVDGMTCEHCERAVTQELLRIDGVEQVRVDAPQGLVWAVVAGRAPSDDEFAAAIDEAGYDLVSAPTPTA